MRKAGFTLIEMIVTILVVSVMFLAIAGFLELGTKGYADSAKRQALQNQARFAIEKISREVRHAVPNSFQVTNGNACLTFYPIYYSGFYRVDPATVSGATDTVRFVIGNDNADIAAVASAARMTINPGRIEDLDGTTNSSISLAAMQTSGAVHSISASFPSFSIGQRHYIYLPGEKVDYCFDAAADSVWVCRGLAAGTDCLTSASRVKVSEHLASGSFRYEDASLVRGGLVHMELRFNNDDEQSDYNHDVQVLNVP